MCGVFDTILRLFYSAMTGCFAADWNEHRSTEVNSEVAFLDILEKNEDSKCPSLRRR